MVLPPGDFAIELCLPEHLSQGGCLRSHPGTASVWWRPLDLSCTVVSLRHGAPQQRIAAAL